MSARLKRMEERKVRKIGRFMQMQDRIDGLNERIYELVCEIEALNVAIEAERREAAVQEAAKSSRNGRNR